MIACEGALELQNQIESRAQHILNTTPEATEREAHESDHMETAVPAVFHRIREWLLQPGMGEQLFLAAETVGAGNLVAHVCEWVFSSSTTPLERGCAPQTTSR